MSCSDLSLQITADAGASHFLENSIYGIFRASLDGGFLSANPVLLQIIACPSLRDLQSLKLPDVFRFPEHHGKLVSSCRHDGLVHSVETEWRRWDGGFVAVRLHLRFVCGLDSSAELQGFVEDVTEIRALEHQLRQAQKFETIGELASGVVHNFNNVIGAILGWAELGFEESQRHPQIAERFARIREQADRAAGLTRELLAIGNRHALQPQAMDLNSIVRSLTTFLSRVISSDIRIDVIARELEPVLADRSQIEQVLINLCLNARDAMPEGGQLLVESELLQLDEAYCGFRHGVLPGCYAVLSVSDTGIGMTPDVLARIFEPSFTTKEPGNGTGMGLATAYSIVKQHGGFIHAYSELGHGSLFRVYLPALPQTGSPSPAATGETPRAIKPEGTETLLIAEDHDSTREMVRQSFVNFGYHVLSAPNGLEALRLCGDETPALAVLDLVMPHLGGIATAVQLRERFPSLAVLLTSGYSEAQNSSASQIPNCFYLQKPYSPTALARAVRRILDTPASEA